MSRIGKKPIEIPAGVTIKLDGQFISAKGVKGELNYEIHPRVKIEQIDNTLNLTIQDVTNKKDKALWGTNRQLIANLIDGVATGFTKQLEINGVGYKWELKGDTLVLHVGFSHPVEFKIPAIITAKVEKNVLTLESIDKHLLGETAASIRKIKKPEPYKGKGIKYMEEIIIRKAGKQVKASSS